MCFVAPDMSDADVCSVGFRATVLIEWPQNVIV